MVGYAFHYKNSRTLNKEKKSRMRSDWIQSFLDKSFFGICEEHKELRKCEINNYCIECDLCMCSHCLAAESLIHCSHRVLQIRRYVYQDVVRIHDMQKLIDCSKVQPYTVNSAKVILLNPRKSTKPPKPTPNAALCDICGRIITEPNRFCSIACKISIDSEVISGPSIRPMTPELDELSPNEDISSSSLLSNQLSDSTEEKILSSTARTSGSKRKGVPRRSPSF